MLALKQDTLSAVPTLMIDSLIDDRCKQAIMYRAAKEGSSSGAAIPGRSCKSKERRISGEDTPAPRSSSEERPATGLRVEPELASRRCSSHEEVTTLKRCTDIPLWHLEAVAELGRLGMTQIAT
ncbi:uncharacterized protein LOC125756230 [Rhipicephalus sanguineus]|uniref:uncharacterized protein LOC125756230 n=1 Tax=Rhipicephalus sanguineus TaxID=34632 RepID=UPI0020C2C4CD|nr:uncharacterized protein LOC125756230 [Rhipicephalus sanguineus]